MAGHGPRAPHLPKPRAHGPRTPPGQAKPLWALIGNWYRNKDRDRHMDRHMHKPCIQFLELVPKGKWARARAKRAQAKRARARTRAGARARAGGMTGAVAEPWGPALGEWPLGSMGPEPFIWGSLAPSTPNLLACPA